MVEGKTITPSYLFNLESQEEEQENRKCHTCTLSDSFSGGSDVCLKLPVAAGCSCDGLYDVRTQTGSFLPFLQVLAYVCLA